MSHWCKLLYCSQHLISSDRRYKVHRLLGLLRGTQPRHRHNMLQVQNPTHFDCPGFRLLYGLGHLYGHLDARE